jgi:creatinine amidohydrolase
MRSLATSTWHAAAAQRDRVLVVPVGATEQHGPHLPLTTDTDIATALAQRLADALPDAVVVAPAVAYGSSGEHEGFAGTISIGQETTEQLLVELGRSATRTWPRVLLVSAHGGNAVPVVRATRRLQEEGRDVRAWTPPWHDAHAGHSETSVMLALAPERVDLDGAEPGALEPLADLLPTLMARGVAAVSPNGVLGDPTGASAQAGEQLLDTALASLRAAALDPASAHDAGA